MNKIFTEFIDSILVFMMERKITPGILKLYFERLQQNWLHEVPGKIKILTS